MKAPELSEPPPNLTMKPEPRPSIYTGFRTPPFHRLAACPAALVRIDPARLRISSVCHQRLARVTCDSPPIFPSPGHGPAHHGADASPADGARRPRLAGCGLRSPSRLAWSCHGRRGRRAHSHLTA